MNLKATFSGLLVMFVLAAAWMGAEVFRPREPAGFYIDAGDAQTVRFGRVLYNSHCAGCHGQKLEGQPGWRERREDGRLPAPPHDETGHTWHHPDAVLFDITRNGLVPGRTAPEGYVSDMPAYAGILTDAEIIAVLAYIKSTWPKEIRELQEQANRNHQQGGAH